MPVAVTADIAVAMVDMLCGAGPRTRRVGTTQAGHVMEAGRSTRAAHIAQAAGTTRLADTVGLAVVM